MIQRELDEGTGMRLVEAFREFGPEQGDPVIDEPRRTAAAVIVETLADLRREFDATWNHVDVDDAISMTLFRLCKVGPRGIRVGDPVNDDGVRSYLRTCLRNNLIDLQRRDIVRAPNTGTAAAVGEPESRLVLEESLDLLFNGIVPDVASSKRKAARRNFITSVTQLKRIATGYTTFEAVVLAEYEKQHVAANPSGASDGVSPHDVSQELEKVKQRLYQRYGRVLKELEREVLRRAESGDVAKDHRVAIDEVLNRLRLRPK